MPQGPFTFKTANEFIQNAETLSVEQPLLPRSLEVPGVERDVGSGMGMGTGIATGTGTKRNSISDPERNELPVEVEVNEAEDVDVDVDASDAGTELVPNVSATGG